MIHMLASCKSITYYDFVCMYVRICDCRVRPWENGLSGAGGAYALLGSDGKVICDCVYVCQSN